MILCQLRIERQTSLSVTCPRTKRLTNKKEKSCGRYTDEIPSPPAALILRKCCKRAFGSRARLSVGEREKEELF